MVPGAILLLVEATTRRARPVVGRMVSLAPVVVVLAVGKLVI
jgi:hypothetical protein